MSVKERSSRLFSFPALWPNVPWGSTSAILYTIFLYFGAQFLAGLILAALAMAGGGSAGLPSGIAGQFYFVLLSDVIILLALWLFLRRRQGKLSALGFSRKPAGRDIAFAIGGYVVYFIMLIVVLSLTSASTDINLEQQQELGFDNFFNSIEKIMGFIALVILPPIVEEVVFRGFLFAGLRKKLRFIWATLIVSVLFASPHLLASSEGLLWVAGIDTFLLSLVLCYLREKTGALWAPIAVHAIKNGLAYMILVTGAAAL